MTPAKVRVAVTEAWQFLRRAEAFLRDAAGDGRPDLSPVRGPRMTAAALRRASLDLTRALSDMRRPD
jgi:hypothetical protein